MRTTDIPYTDRPADVAIDAGEPDYLLGILNRYFRTSLTPGDVVSAYSDVRPLFDGDAQKGASAVTRDYELEVDGGNGRAPILSAFGGKLTTYRKLSEYALEKLAPFYTNLGPAWTAHAPLPGGEMPDADFEAWLAGFAARHPWLPGPLAAHYGRLYGTRAEEMLEGAAGLAHLGQHFGGLVYEREARWLIDEEWAERPDDILECRTKHGLFLTESERAGFEVWMRAAAAA